MTARALLLLILIPYALWLIFAYDYHFLDGANLLFHEAGHVFFGLFGQTIGMLGGTLGQLVFPVAAGVQFLVPADLSTRPCAECGWGRTC